MIGQPVHSTYTATFPGMRRVITIVSMLVGLTLVGTVGLRLIEGAPWLDCLYMAVITLSTIGLEDAVGLSSQGKVFIIVYIVLGLGTFTYSAFQIGQWVVSVEMGSILEKRRMEKNVKTLRNHFIVCGLGRVGTTVCGYLHERNQPFIVVDTDETRVVAFCEEHSWLYVIGDATHDEVLRKAGIERARSLTTVLATDADNLYVVLSSRMLNSRLQIIARASDETAIDKLERAGASRVVSPVRSGAIKMARFMISPTIEDFLEIADERDSDLELADVQITEKSPFVGKQLMQTNLRDMGVMVIGIRRANGDRLMPPPGNAVIEAGDSLFAFGNSEAVNAMIDNSIASG